jgi:hypothetical protein
MGVSVYPRLRREVVGIDPLAMVGKALAHEMERLEPVARHAGVMSLGDFVAISRAEVDELAMEDPPDDLEELPEPGPDEYSWFAPEDGLETVRALTKHVDAMPDAGSTKRDLLEDLEFLRRVLEAASQSGVTFNLGMDI